MHDGELPRTETAGRYAYLLGQYLGDGHLVTRARVPVLRIYCCTDYPGIIDEIAATIDAVRHSPPGRMAGSHTHRMIKIQFNWNHRPCRFPQHGPGMKHNSSDRAGELAENHRRARSLAPDPRLDPLRYYRVDSISVAKRDAVALMDAHIGPKA